MARLGAEHDSWVMERVFSPDARIALDYLPYPDPRTQYELEAPEAVALRDAETGAELARFGGWSMIIACDWPAGGGVLLTLHKGVQVRIAPDLASFDPQGGDSRPIAELPDWLRSLMPPAPPPVQPLTFAQRLGLVALTLGAVVIVSLGLAWAFGMLP